jgi:hypothetical protein
MANWRIAYIVGDKPYFLTECEKSGNIISVYIDALLWLTEKHNGQCHAALPGHYM